MSRWLLLYVVPLSFGCRQILGIGDRQGFQDAAIDAPPDAAPLCKPPGAPGQKPSVGAAPTFALVSGGVTATAPVSGFKAGTAFDLDHDGDSDLLLLDSDFAISNPNPARVAVWRASGGKYTEASGVLSLSPSSQPSQALAFDPNGDGRDDVFVGQQHLSNSDQNPTAYVLEQQTNNTLVETGSTVLSPPTSPGFYFAGGATAVDVNCDGAIDLLETRPYDKPLLRINDGQGTLVEAPTALPMQADPLATNLFCDFNRDGAPDLFIGGCNSMCGSQPDALFLNNGYGRFHAAAAGALPTRPGNDTTPQAGACFDADLDGYPDIFIANVDPSGVMILSYWRNRGDGTFVDATATIAQPWGTSGIFRPWLTTADFNHDGWPDLLVATDSLSRPYVLVNNGNGLTNGPTLSGGLAFVVQADLDGKPDIVTTSGFGAGFQANLYRNTTP